MMPYLSSILISCTHSLTWGWMRLLVLYELAAWHGTYSSYLCSIYISCSFWEPCWFLQWSPGGRGSFVSLENFVKARLADFTRDRAKTDRSSTSCLSPYIHYGELSIRFIYFVVSSFRQCPGMRRLFHDLLLAAWTGLLVWDILEEFVILSSSATIEHGASLWYLSIFSALQESMIWSSNACVCWTSVCRCSLLCKAWAKMW